MLKWHSFLRTGLLCASFSLIAYFIWWNSYSAALRYHAKVAPVNRSHSTCFHGAHTLARKQTFKEPGRIKRIVKAQDHTTGT